FKEIDLLAEAGYTRVNMNLEVWNKNIFAGICPGKAQRIGWERWLEALEYAAARLGRGNVRSVFVSGIEPMSSFLEGVDYLASKGVFAFANPWCPDPGSLMEGHRPPYPFWHRELARKMVDTWQRHDLTLGQLARFAAIEGYLYYDEWRSRC
ncbi:MAG: nitrogen fixation protein NifB, partial [Candidatus Tectomicrobia bacterium]|nr:nitrogen fixation protein NifB [Candidatus Tectomicrobia bacterium]